MLPLAEHLLTYQQGQAVLTELVAGPEPRLVPFGAHTRRQRMRSARRFACVQAVLGHR